MDAPTTRFALLQDLDRRHDDLLVRLEELDKRVERTLAECLPPPAKEVLRAA